MIQPSGTPAFYALRPIAVLPKRMTQAEAARELCVWSETMKRRLSCGLQLSAKHLVDLRPGEKSPDAT